ncbi:unnamed protein product [Cyclocybe aegerita]|uniref:C2H2-type domain-containing protein n=1 Tax=Cyclocybe aegerita TaxID=1973307 RepID=A0A8S0XK17_CYCAE|nr:unnamed protein product [Cyclocybe aegerita]
MQSPLSPVYPYDLNSPYSNASSASYQTDPSPVSDQPADDDYALYASAQIAIYNADLPHPYEFDPAMWPEAKKQQQHVYHVPRSHPAYPPQYHSDLKAVYPAAPPNHSPAPPRIKQEDLAAFPANIPAYPPSHDLVHSQNHHHIPMSHNTHHHQHLLQSHAHDTQNPQTGTGTAASPFALLSPLQQPQPTAYYSPPFRPQQQQQPQQYQQQVYASTGTVHPADVSPQSDSSVSPLSTYADLSGAVACDPRFVCPPQAQQQQCHPHPHQQNGFHPVGGLDSDMGMGEMDLDGHISIVSGGMAVGMAPHVMEDVGMVVVGGMGEEDADGEEDWGDHAQMQVQQGYEQHHQQQQQQTEYMDDGEHEQASHSRTSTSTSNSTSTASTSTTSRGRILRRPIHKSHQHQPEQDQDNHATSPSEEDEFDDESESEEESEDDDDDEFVLKPRSRTRGGMGAVGSGRRRGSAVPVSASAMAAVAQAQLQAQAAQAHAGHGQGQGMPSSYPTTSAGAGAGAGFGGYGEGRTLRPRSVSRYNPYADGGFSYDGEQSMFSQSTDASYDGRRRYNSHPGASPASTSTSSSQPSRSTSSASNPSSTSSTPSSTSSTSTHTTTTSTARRRLRPSPTMPIPVPVPNLTKKSRGRRVPTMSSLEDMRSAASGAGKKRQSAAAGGKNARMYLCDVEGCGKCFARGEHLKRHVRSIHTYEKPHRCPYPGAARTLAGMITWASICACTRTSSRPRRSRPRCWRRSARRSRCNRWLPRLRHGLGFIPFVF